MKLMTAEEFIEHAEREIYSGEFDEMIGEAIAQAKSEVAMFGDAGPGQIKNIRESIAEYNCMLSRYNKLTGNTLPTMAVPSFGHRWVDEHEMAY
jgi:hypothetical protein